MPVPLSMGRKQETSPSLHRTSFLPPRPSWTPETPARRQSTQNAERANGSVDFPSPRTEDRQREIKRLVVLAGALLK